MHKLRSVIGMVTHYEGLVWKVYHKMGVHSFWVSIRCPCPGWYNAAEALIFVQRDINLLLF
jgi:hypothetical protein